MKKAILLLISHFVVGVIGFGAGVYFLPILIASPAPTAEEVAVAAKNAQYTGEFRRDLQDSDALHWGEGTVSISSEQIALKGEVAPGPNYKLYLSPKFVETEKDFLELKASMVMVGDIKTFENFILPIPRNIDPGQFTTAVVWCEAFGEFITAAQYQ